MEKRPNLFECMYVAYMVVDYCLPGSIINVIEENPTFVSVVMSYGGQVHDPTLDPRNPRRLFHFVEEKVRQKEMTCKIITIAKYMKCSNPYNPNYIITCKHG